MEPCVEEECGKCQRLTPSALDEWWLHAGMGIKYLERKPQPFALDNSKNVLAGRKDNARLRLDSKKQQLQIGSTREETTRFQPSCKRCKHGSAESRTMLSPTTAQPRSARPVWSTDGDDTPAK
jgi:hypothetical protein